MCVRFLSVCFGVCWFLVFFKLGLFRIYFIALLLYSAFLVGLLYIILIWLEKGPPGRVVPVKELLNHLVINALMI